MKVLNIDYDFYQFPDEISTIEEFVKHITENYHSFIQLVQFQTENCNFPYFIKEDTKTVYLNISQIEHISEADATVLCRLDYDSRLERVVQEKCIDCVHYDEDSNSDNLKGHRDKLSLDGECWGYEKKTD